MQLALGAAGAVATTALGIGPAWGWLGGIVLGQLLFPTKKSTAAEDLSVTGSAYGTAIQQVYGVMKIGGDIIWSEDIEKVEAGGKGLGKGGSSGSSGKGKGGTGAEYYGHFAVMFCEGPVAAVRRVWLDNTLAIDFSDPTAPTHKYGESKSAIYLGTEDQEPDPHIESWKAVGDVPAYRGRCYIVFRRLPLADFGGRLPSVTAEIVQAATPSFALKRLEVTWPGGSVASGTTLMTSPNPTDPFLYYEHGGLAWKMNRTTGQLLWEVTWKADVEYLTWVGDHSLYAPADRSIAQDPQVDPVTGDLMFLVGTDPSWLVILDGNTGLFKRGMIGPSGLDDLPGAMIVSPWQPDTAYTPVTLWSYAAALNSIDNKRFFYRTESGTAAVATDGRFWTQRDYVWSVSRQYAVDPWNSRSWVVGQDAFADHFWIIGLHDDSISADLAGVLSPAIDAYADQICYDHATDSLILCAATADGYAAYRLDADDPSTQTGVYVADEGSLGDGTSHIFGGGTQRWCDGTFRTGDAGRWYVAIDTRTMTLAARYDAQSGGTSGWGDAGGTRMLFYDPIINAVWSAHSTGTLYYMPRVSRDPIELRAAVAQMLGEAGYESTDYDVASLTDTFRGLVRDRVMPPAEMLQVLEKLYSFEMISSGAKLKAVKLNSSVVAAIGDDELGAQVVTDGRDEAIAKVAESTARETELPRRLTVKYYRWDDEYASGSAVAQRIQLNVASTKEETLDVAVTLTDSEAKTMASRLLWRSWAERTKIAFAVPGAWLRLDPADRITVTHTTDAGEVTHSARLVKMRIGDGFVLTCEAVEVEPSTFDIEETAPAPALPARPSIGIPVPSRAFVLDLPPVGGSLDNTFGAYYGAAPAYAIGGGTDWRGAAIYQGSVSDALAPWHEVVSAPPWGYCKSVLPATTGLDNGWDDASTLTVVMNTDHELGSLDDLAVLNGGNTAVVGGEVIQFATATLTADRTYVLSRLLRGRFGSEAFIAGHAVGETFILLGEGGLHHTAVDLGLRNLARYYAAYSRTSGYLPPRPAEAITLTGRSLKPWSPVHLAAVRAGDITVSWVRRTRFGGGWLDGTGAVPLNESSEAYEIDVLDAGGTVKRTLTASTPSVVYTQEATDFPSGGAITFKVYQMSGTVGRGYPGEVTL